MKAIWIIRAALWLVWAICGADGVCIALGETFLGQPWGNILSGLFFALLAGLFWLAWRFNRRALVRRLTLWGGVALLGMVSLLLVLWGLLAVGAPGGLYSLCYVLAAVLSAPLSSCGIMLLPVFGWALALVGGWMLLRRMKKGDPA